MADNKKQTKDRELWQRVGQVLRPYSAIASADKLLIAVSGGADSLALLHLLWQHLGAKRLVVGHLNHKLRPEADADAAFVAKIAAAWQIPYKIGAISVRSVADANRVSLEAAGRVARYRFLAKVAYEVGAAALVVAHHADDQAETVLLHILRGSGSSGLQGMLPVGVVPESPGLKLLRPFLTTSRAEIEAYCARHGLSPRQDASNEDLQFTRNRIRHELMPLLQTFNPQISTNLQQLATITADELAVLEAQFSNIWPKLIVAQGEGWLVVDREKFVEQPVACQRLALRRVMQQVRPLHTEISFRTVESARSLILARKSGTEATLPGGLVMQVLGHEVTFGDREQAPIAPLPQLVFDHAQPLPIPGKLNLGDAWTITATLAQNVSLKEIHQNKNPWRAFVSLAENDRLWLRPFTSGERFQPLGLGGHSQTILDLLSDRKIARLKRPYWPIVATQSHPAWIVGLHLDHRVRVTKNSLRVVALRCFQK